MVLLSLIRYSMTQYLKMEARRYRLVEVGWFINLQYTPHTMIYR